MSDSSPLVNMPPHGATLKAIEKDAILEALRRCGNNQSKAAKLLGVSDRVIAYKMSAHGIPRCREQPSETTFEDAKHASF